MKLTKNYFALAKAKNNILKTLKSLRQLFGVSEATLFETVFEAPKNYEKNPKSVVFRLF